MKNIYLVFIAFIFVSLNPNPIIAADSKENLNQVRRLEVKTQIEENKQNRQEIKTKIETNKQERQEIKQEVKENRATISSQRQEKKEIIKSTSCQARLNNIKTRSENLTSFTNRVIETFDKISLRVQEYYTTKIAPTNKIANYATLVSDIAAQKLISQTVLVKAQTLTTDFDCQNDDPKVLVRDFNEQMKLVKNSLASYRSSIKNLIKAVHPNLKEISPTPLAKN